MLKQAFGDNSLDQTQTYDWYKHLKNGRISTDDDDRSGRPSTGKTPENVAKVRDLILQDRRLTIQDLCNTLGLSYGTCQRILSEELNMRRIAAKFVPRLLQNEQKQHRLEDLFFLYIDGIVHKEFVLPGQTINKEFYHDVLRLLRENMRRKRPEKWRTNNWVLHHDNARPHTADIVQEFLAKNKMAVVPHPPYSPDLAPCDFFLFLKMKIKLKGRRFDTAEEIQAETQTVLNTLTKKDFQDAFQKWQKRWDRCMRSQGDYFEGDGAEYDLGKM
ncbi:hypothetical protein B7P43_G12319 [Cryptotermes secundus]|uniref:Tc1-like transposase DDE domain-containing protein n=1 Tax=Cryptotermes secundus TaxID=105785 RepID=A0A2J7RL24_9NEOP|nr:hypothetical protein B7P43_G12319 [Cryptotermes secundus]